MNSSRDNAFIELEEILARIDDDIATSADRSRLNDLLSGDPEACEFYLDYMAFSAALELEFGVVQPIGMHDDQRPENVLARTTHMILQKCPRVATTMWNNRGWAAAAAALMLSVSVAGFMLMAKNRSDDGLSVNGSDTPDAGLALLRRTLETDFSLPHIQPTAGDILYEGDLKLDFGVAQIELYDGARLLVEGPAQLSLIDKDEIMLTRGRIRALVPPQSGSLLVHTGRMKVEARSSEFGIMVTSSGKAQVHNFEGRVTVKSLPDSSDQEVLPGLGMEVSAVGTPGPLEADSKKFLTWVDIVESSRANARRNYRDWRTRIGELSTDPRVMLYYTFEDQSATDHIVTDHSSGNSNAQNGAIIGSEWAEGRWKGKGAMRFQRMSDRIRFEINRHSPSMTWATWVKFDRLEPYQTALIHSETSKPGNPLWHISPNGELELSIADKDGQFVSYTSPSFTKHSEAPNKWYQLVSVYHADARTVIHYVNGKKLSQHRISDLIPISLGQLQVANCNPELGADSKNHPCSLSGTIDEVLLFSEPLGSAEIRQMYQAGRP